MSTVPINYAKFEGDHSIPAAVVFAILYAPLIVWFARFLFLRFDRPVISLTLFCTSEFGSDLNLKHQSHFFCSSYGSVYPSGHSHWRVECW